MRLLQNSKFNIQVRQDIRKVQVEEPAKLCNMSARKHTHTHTHSFIVCEQKCTRNKKYGFPHELWGLFFLDQALRSSEPVTTNKVRSRAWHDFETMGRILWSKTTWFYFPPISKINVLLCHHLVLIIDYLFFHWVSIVYLFFEISL
jgi:hypothetical protein